MTRAVEQWLKSDDDEKFAEAAIRCQHAGGFCLSDGYCHYDGTCFRSDYMALKMAARRISDLAADQPKDIGDAMRGAVDWLNAEANSIRNNAAA